MKQEAGDLVSVVMPCYNAATTIRESASSALLQSHEKVELIVVDDGSTDGTLSELSGLAAKNRNLRMFKQEKRGAGAARNRALSEAAGHFVAFLDADDYWAPNCLAKLVQALHESGADIAYCGWQNIGLPGKRGEPFIPPDYGGVDRVELLLGGNRWPIHAALTRKSAIDAVGGFNEQWTSCMDYDLWLKLASESTLIRVPEVLAYYRHHEGEQITKDQARVALNHFQVQRAYLAAHPIIRHRLGRSRTRRLTLGELLSRGYRCYWGRDLLAARKIFREVMKNVYGSVVDWLYMLPALLPLSFHRALTTWREKFPNRESSE